MSMIAYDTLLRELEERFKSTMTAELLAQSIDTIKDVLSGYKIEQTATEANTGEDMLLNTFLDAKRVEGLSSKSLDRYRYVLRRLLDHFGLISNSITTLHIRTYLADEKKRGISDGTLRGLCNVFKSYFGWLAREGLIAKDPVGNIRTIKTAKIIRKAYTEVELDKLKACCKTIKEKAIFCFLDASGCRISEAV